MDKVVLRRKTHRKTHRKTSNTSYGNKFLRAAIALFALTPVNSSRIASIDTDIFGYPIFVRDQVTHVNPIEVEYYVNLAEKEHNPWQLNNIKPNYNIEDETEKINERLKKLKMLESEEYNDTFTSEERMDLTAEKTELQLKLNSLPEPILMKWPPSMYLGLESPKKYFYNNLDKIHSFDVNTLDGEDLPDDWRTNVKVLDDVPQIEDNRIGGKKRKTIRKARHTKNYKK